MSCFNLPKLVLASLFLIAPLRLFAAELAAPEGEIILVISGDLGVTNVGDTAQFDRDMLEQLGVVTIETTTIWTEGLQTFTGVPLAQLMDVVQARGKTLSATAINDYAVDIPAENWGETWPIVSFLHNDEPMSIRDKGPLWIVYPYDSNPDFQTEVIYSRSIWQLDRIIVKD